MADRIPIGTIPGLTSQLDGVDILIATLGVAGTVSRIMLRHTDYDDGGATDTSVVGNIRNATAGGGDAIAFTIPDQTQSYTTTGTMAVSASESIYLRVTTGSASMNLTGWVEISGAAGATTALTTLARVKQLLGITASTSDDLLNELIASVSAEIQSWLGRKILQTTATAERYGHAGYDAGLYLTGYPIISVTSLTEDSTALVEDTDFELGEADKRAGRVLRISGGDVLNWPSGRGHITTTYSHGYATVPADVAQAATELVAYDYKRSRPGGGRLGLDGDALESGGGSGYRTRQEFWRDQLTRLAPYVRRDP